MEPAAGRTSGTDSRKKRVVSELKLRAALRGEDVFGVGFDLHDLRGWGYRPRAGRARRSGGAPKDHRLKPAPLKPRGECQVKARLLRAGRKVLPSGSGPAA